MKVRKIRYQMARSTEVQRKKLNNVTNQQSSFSINSGEEENNCSSADISDCVITNQVRRNKEGEQAIFMQVKCKDDAVTNNQDPGQDWRKNMVSGIENVKGFGESTVNTTIKGNGQIGEKGEENGTTSSSENLERVKTVGRKGDSVAEWDDKSNHRLVNGNGMKHVSSTGESGDDSRTKTDDGSGGCVSKEEIVNKCTDDDRNNLDAMEVDVEDAYNGASVLNGTVKDEKNGTGMKAIISENRAQTGMNETEDNTPAIAIINNSESTTVSVSKKEVSPEISISAAGTTGTVNMIAVRKKNKNAPEEVAKPVKKVKLITTGLSSSATKSSNETEISKGPSIQANSAPSSVLTGVSLAPPTRIVVSGASPSRAESTSRLHNRLPAIRAETVFNQQVNVNADCSYSLQVTNHFKRPDGLCHQLVCTHSATSLHGLEWTLCTDAPICAVTGDGHRIAVVCENATAHVLDVKGRYAFPPIMLSGQPSKILLHGAFLAVITARALVHVWNVHSKSVVLKSESLVPLLTHTETDKDRTLDVSRIQVAAGGLPIIVLNTGKTFMYSGDLNTWFLISDPRGLVSAPIALNSLDQSLSSRMALFSNDGRMRTKPEPAIISHIKLKLATCTEMKNPDGMKQWIIALAKSLATQGLEKELRQLCDDLLGPTHSSAKFTNNWKPKIIGLVDKRELLRRILTLLLEDLKYQDLYCEFDEMLKEVETQSEMDVGITS